jgi:thioredoxin 1
MEMRKIFLPGIIFLMSIGCCIAAKTPEETAIPAQSNGGGKPAGIPSLIDLGRTFCIPCKMMAPILEELKKEYAGRMHVEFIDVGDNPQAARKYGIRMIPTQVFLDASGKELYRHVGFFSKEDILKKWKELGVDLAVKHAK